MHMGSGMCTAKFGWNADEAEAEGSFEEEAEGSVEEETEVVLQRSLRGPSADFEGDMGSAPILVFGRRLISRKVKRGPGKGRKVRIYVCNVFCKY